jgi:hypothetical protein
MISEKMKSGRDFAKQQRKGSVELLPAEKKVGRYASK